jgi:hypothetical protein
MGRRRGRVKVGPPAAWVGMAFDVGWQCPSEDQGFARERVVSMRALVCLLVFSLGCSKTTGTLITTAGQTIGGLASGASGTGATGTTHGASGGLGSASAGSGTAGVASSGGQTGGTQAGNGNGNGTNGAGTAGTTGATGNGGNGGNGGTGGYGCLGPPAGQVCGVVGDPCGCDNDCCAGDGCSYGYCRLPIDAGCIGNPDCASGNCLQAQCICSPAGSVCVSSNDCCGGFGCQRIEPDAGWIEGECCNPVDAGCGQNSDCCGQNCHSGKCQCVPINVLYNTGPCRADSDCCSGRCSRGLCCQLRDGGCQTNGDCCFGACNGGFCGCSSQNFGACGEGADCCPPLGCVSSANYGNGANVCCLGTGQTCQSPNDCCSGDCTNQQCVCLGNGSSCGNGGSCCDGGICAVPDGGYYQFVCCQANGSPCHFGNECCSGTCSHGSCI